MENIYRNIYCGNITIKDIEKKVRISGFVNSIRNFGSLYFLTIRDESGIVQVVSENDSFIKNLTRESTVTVEGIVKKRDGEVNPKMKTGEIEIILNNLKILSKSLNVLPFEVNRSKEAPEDLRLKYRYLDLRNKEVHDKIVFRSKVIDFIRSTMKSMDFTEISTPIISTSSPEGARDFVIPSRNFKGKFYALPQAPQMYKQLLMTSGFEKYFQIAPCFRDEDCRADRTLEFYQLDFEMSYVEEEDIYNVGEKIFYDIFSKFGNKKISSRPFKRISFKESMEKYGTDKPDLRNPLIIEDISSIFSNTKFNGFKDKIIKCIKVESCSKPNSWYKKLEEFLKNSGAEGLCYIKTLEKGVLNSSIIKFLSEDEIKNIKTTLKLKENNVVFIVAGNKNIQKYSGILRKKLGEELELIKNDVFEFCIINDFPMYEWNDGENKWDFAHNPFSMPKGGLEAFNKKIDDIVAYQYDFVCNGFEMSSGAVRNHDIDIMKKAFSLVGYDEEVIKDKFRALYTAFQYGCPPHAGMAPGIDRMIMLLTDEENLREVQVFPPNVSGADLLMGGPNEITKKQLKELNIGVLK